MRFHAPLRKIFPAIFAALVFTTSAFADYLFHDASGDYTLSWPECPTATIPTNCIANKGMTLAEATACLGSDTTGKWAVIERNSSEYRTGTLPVGIYRFSTYSNYSNTGGDVVVFIDREAYWMMNPVTNGGVYLSFTPLVPGTDPHPYCNIQHERAGECRRDPGDSGANNNLLTHPLGFDWPNGFKVPGTTDRAQMTTQTGVAAGEDGAILRWTGPL
jgi:hypothetical protein